MEEKLYFEHDDADGTTKIPDKDDKLTEEELRFQEELKEKYKLK